MRATKGRLIQVATCFEDQAPSLADLTDDEFNARRDELNGEWATLSAIDNADLTDEQIDRMEELGALLTTLRVDSARRVALAAVAPVEAPVVVEDAPEALVAAAPAPVTAGPAPVASAPAPVVAAPLSAAKPRLMFTASSDVKGVSAGSDLDIAKLSQLMVAKATSLPRTRPTKRNEYTLATITKQFDPRAIVTGSNAEEAIRFATNEANTPKGSLVASGGWCAPSENLYALAAQLSTTEGIYSLPEILVARGGINSTLGPQFADLYADTGFCFTEAQDIAGDYDPTTGGVQPKPCFKVECPDFAEVRLDVCGVCISAGYLQNKAYPEMTERTISEALVAHQHRLASRILADVIAGSDATVAPSANINPGAVAPLLEAIELQVWDVRYRHRMSPSRTLEAVFPLWVKGLLRADLSRRLGVDLLSVPDSRLSAWFSERGVSAQFIYNFDDLGGPGGIESYPETVRFVLYPAGTWVRGSSDVIDLGVVHDSTQFAFNNYTALFTEEGWLVLKRGHESRVVTVPVCASGATGAGVDLCAIESPGAES